MINRRGFEIISVVLPLLLAAGVQTVFKACGPKEDGSWMHCHDVQNYVFYLALVMTVLSVLAIIMRKSKAAVIGFNVIVIGLSVVTFLLPGTIMSMCMMNTMRCYSVMMPCVRCFCIMIAATAVMLVLNKVSDDVPALKVFKSK